MNSAAEIDVAEAAALRRLPRFETADGARYADPLAVIELEQAFAAARTRGYLTLPPVVPPPGPDDVDVRPLLAHVQLRTLWPPPETRPTCRLTLVLVPAEAVPGLAARLGLTADDLYLDTDKKTPSIILGEAAMGRDERYGPLDWYPAAEACRLTRLFRQPQVVEEERQRQAAERARAQAEKDHQKLVEHLRAEEARQQAERERDPAYKVRRLEQRLAEIEAATKPT